MAYFPWSATSSSIDAVIGRACLLRPTPVRPRLCARRRPSCHLKLPSAHMVCTTWPGTAIYAIQAAPARIGFIRQLGTRPQKQLQLPVVADTREPRRNGATGSEPRMSYRRL
jgi:hypothetical protein